MKSTLLACALFLSLPTLAKPPEVPIMFRGDARHTGVYPATAIPKGKLKWTFTTGNKIRSAPAFYNNTIYFGSDDGYLYAVDAASGTLKWKFKAAGRVSSSPAIYHGAVFFQAGDAAIYSIDAASGREKWIFRTGTRIPPEHPGATWEYEHSSPLVADETVYIGSADGYVYALDTATGKQKWAFKTQGRLRATPAFADGVLYAGSMDGNLYALDAHTGSAKWKFKTAGNQYFPVGEVQSSPAIGNGIVYFGARDGALYAVDLTTGTQKWKKDQENFSWVIGAPTVYKDAVIVATSDAKDIKAYDAATGELKWRAASPSPDNFLASPTIFGNVLYVGDYYGTMLWLNADTGKLMGGFSTDGRINAAAIVHDGVLYFGSDDDTLYALQ